MGKQRDYGGVPVHRCDARPQYQRRDDVVPKVHERVRCQEYCRARPKRDPPHEFALVPNGPPQPKGAEAIYRGHRIFYPTNIRFHNKGVYVMQVQSLIINNGFVNNAI